MGDEHFIPFRKTDVVDFCAEELTDDEHPKFRDFAEILASTFHERFHQRLVAIEDEFFVVHPPADLCVVAQPTPQELRDARRRLEEELAVLAEDANFTPISEEEISTAFAEHSLLKVRMEVDRDAIDTAMFFRRGESQHTAEVPHWFGLRRKNIEYTRDSKVLMYVTFKDAEHFTDTERANLPFTPGTTIVKLFEDVPRNDLEMLFPNVQPRMRTFDKLLIGVPAVVSGIVVVTTKLIAPLGLLLLFAAFLVGARDESVEIDQTALVTVGAALAALGGYVVRQYGKFTNRKIKFMKVLAENLYYRNLDNDAGVFYRLLGAAENAEFKETILAYHFLRTAERPLTAEEIDQRIEGWFAQRWNEKFDFDTADALTKLRELDLVTADEEGRATAADLPEAKRRLDRQWDNIFDYNSRQSRGSTGI